MLSRDFPSRDGGPPAPPRAPGHGAGGGHQILSPGSIDSSLIQFKQEVWLGGASEAKFIPIRYDCREMFIQAPKLPLPFGLDVYNGLPDGLSVSLTDADIDEGVSTFRRAVQLIEERVQKEQAARRWRASAPAGGEAGGKKSLALKPKFRSSIKQADGYAPRVSFKFKREGGRLVSELYDEKRNPCDVNYIVAGGYAKCLVQLTGVLVKSDSYQCTWTIVQARVHPPNRFIGYSLLDDEPPAADSRGSVSNMSVGEIMSKNPHLLELFKIFQQFQQLQGHGVPETAPRRWPDDPHGRAPAEPAAERAPRPRMPLISPNDLLAQRNQLRRAGPPAPPPPGDSDDLVGRPFELETRGARRPKSPAGVPRLQISVSELINQRHLLKKVPPRPAPDADSVGPKPDAEPPAGTFDLAPADSDRHETLGPDEST